MRLETSPKTTSQSLPTGAWVVSVLGAFLMTCGGRSANPGDAGTEDAGSDSDTDPELDAGGSDGGEALLHCYDGVCPWELPYCCYVDSYTECSSNPDEFIAEHHHVIDAGCVEQIRESSFLAVDCIDGGLFHPEECPGDFPHCCSNASDGGDVCVDHKPYGWQCDD